MDSSYPVPGDWAACGAVDAERPRAMYARSTEDPIGFWGDEAKRLAWIKPFTVVQDTSFDRSDFRIRRWWTSFSRDDWTSRSHP